MSFSVFVIILVIVFIIASAIALYKGCMNLFIGVFMVCATLILVIGVSLKMSTSYDVIQTYEIEEMENEIVYRDTVGLLHTVNKRDVQTEKTDRDSFLAKVNKKYGIFYKEGYVLFEKEEDEK